MAQAAGIRVLSFRHEQNAGYAASIAGFLTKKPGICLTVSAPGFLNGLTALAHATTNCFPMILISRLVRARDRGPAAGRLRGDGPARHRQAAVQGRVPRAACAGHRHRPGARDPRGSVGPSGRRLSRSAGQAVRPGDGRRGRQEVARQGDRRGAGADSGSRCGQARARCAEGRQASPDHPRQGRGLRAGRRCDPRLGREERHSVPADEHGQGPPARHAPAVRGRSALDRAEGRRRRHADRRAPQLAALARQGQDLGRARRRSSSRSISSPRRWTPTSRSPRRWSAISARASSALLDGMGGNWPAPPADWIRRRHRQARRERRQDGAAADEQQLADGLPRRARRRCAPSSRNGPTPSWSTKAPTRSISRAASSTCYQPRKRLDVGTWGIMGIGMGYAIAAAIETGKPVLAIEGDSAFGFSGMEVETICRYKLPVCVVIFNNDGIYRGTDVNTASSGPGDDRVRQGLALRQDDRGLRRRRRQCDIPGRAEARRERRPWTPASRPSSTR